MTTITEKDENDNSFPIRSLMELYNRNKELLETDKMVILQILIFLLIFSIGCFLGAIIVAPICGWIFGVTPILGVGQSVEKSAMTHLHVSNHLFENIRTQSVKMNLDHELYSGTSPERDEEQIIHLERDFQKMEGEERGDRTRIPEFREKLPKGSIFYKYFISNGRPVKLAGSKILPKTTWKCFKNGWQYSFVESLSRQQFYIVTQKPLHGSEIQSKKKYHVFPLLSQMSEDFPFKNHLETEIADQSQIRDSVVSYLNQIKGEKYVNNDQSQLLNPEMFERIASNQVIIDDLLSDTEFQVENVLQNPKLSFDWKRSSWNEQMEFYEKYERLRKNHQPGGFMIPYQKIYINNYPHIENPKLHKLLLKSIPVPPPFLQESLHLRSISMRISYSDDILSNNFILPLYQTNKELLFIQVKGKTKFLLFDPLHSDSMKPIQSSIDWKIEKDWKDSQTTISSVDPFNIVENFNKEKPEGFLSKSIVLSVDVDEHEVLFVPAFWWVLELGIHSKTEENVNLMLREEFEPHHSMLDITMSGLLKGIPDVLGVGGNEWQSVDIQKRPVKLPNVQI